MNVDRLTRGIRYFVAQNVRPAATLKRAEVVDGKRGAPVTVATDVPATLVMPMDRHIQERVMLDSLIEGYYTFTNYDDVRGGDTWVQAGKTYVVRLARQWAENDFGFQVVVLEKVKTD